MCIKDVMICGGFTYKSIIPLRSVHAHGQTISGTKAKYCLANFGTFFGFNHEEQDIAV